MAGKRRVFKEAFKAKVALAAAKSQFTVTAFTSRLKKGGAAISMDSRGRARLFERVSRATSRRRYTLNRAPDCPTNWVHLTASSCRVGYTQSRAAYVPAAVVGHSSFFRILARAKFG